MEYDVFLSHASEDKKEFVEPLAYALQKSGLKVWYDDFELKLGDSLSEKIDFGLANSRYGVVVLSQAFFGKNWTRTELDALVTRQNNEGTKVILPIWHKINAEEVKKFSSILASKIAARSSDGIDSVVAQILDVCMEKETSKAVSVFQEKGKYGLREQCLDIIRENDEIAWRKLIIENTEPIPDQLKKWKQDKGDVVSHKGGKDWEEALIEAANICLPGFIPIFSATEAGKINFWKEAMSFTKRLLILKDEMGGGSVWAIEIGYHMLYVVGSLGLSIAAGLKLLDLSEKWLMLKMPNYEGSYEIPWIKVYVAHYLPQGLRFDSNEPFKFLLSISQSDLISGFFPNPKRMVNNVLMANLLSSMIEFRLCCQDKNCLKDLIENKQLSFTVPPIWCLTKHEEFRSLTLNLFNDSDGLIHFVFPQKSALGENFWKYWNNWHKRCIGHWSHHGSVMFRARFLMLPGQADLRENI